MRLVSVFLLSFNMIDLSLDHSPLNLPLPHTPECVKLNTFNIIYFSDYPEIEKSEKSVIPNLLLVDGACLKQLFKRCSRVGCSKAVTEDDITTSSEGDNSINLFSSI